MKFHLILAGLWVILNTITCSKISNKNILLPLADIDVEYVLTAEGGCFEWSTSNSAIQVTGQDSQGCTKSTGIVRVITRQPSQSFIYVKPPSQSTAQYIVEVVVGEIDKLSIITKQKQLDLDTQEELHVSAQDSKGNTFTTLEGLKFSWDVQHLEMVKLAESGLKVSDRRAKLEFNSDIVVIKGKRMGPVRVTTQVIESKYIDKKITTYVDLMVIEKFQFFPDYPIFYLPTHSKIQFSLLRADGRTRILLPSSHHKWSVTSKLSSIENDGILTTQTIEKSQKLNVFNTTECQISAIYHVVNPKSIDIDIWEDGKERREDKVTSLVVGRLYRFQAYMISEENQRLFSSDVFTYNSDDIGLVEQTVRSEVERSNVELQYSRANMKASVLIHFVKPLSINTIFKTYIHLPVQERYQLSINGGSGQYHYQQKYISPNIFEIQVPNLMVSNQIGENELFVYDENNFYNSLEVKVYVSDATQIIPVEYRKELLVNEADATYYQAVGDKQIGNYTWCKSVSFSSAYVGALTTITTNSDDSNYLICSGLILQSTTVGQYNLIINAQGVSVTQQVRVYDNLYFEQPYYLITPFSTLITKVLGGPTSWDQNPYTEDLSEGIIRINVEKYHFNCFQKGAQFLISRINKKSDLLPNPKLVRSTLPVRCELPDAFKVLNDQNIEINWLFREDKVLVNVVAVLQNNLFHNSSSLQLEYETPGLLYSNRILQYDLKSGTSDCKFIVSSNKYNNNPATFQTVQSELAFFIHHTLKLIPSGDQYVLLDQDVYFQIQSSTQNIQCQYDKHQINCEKDSVVITPKNIGHYKLTVYDLSLNYSVSATLTVVDPEQLNLELNQQITVVGGSVNATSTFLKGSQLVHVTNWNNLQLVDSFDLRNSKSGNRFIINGHKEGLFRLQTQFGTARSNVVELKVIPKLVSDTVYMPPECETHVILPIQTSFSYYASSIPEADVSVSQNIITIKSKTIRGTFYIPVTLKQSQIIDTVQIQVVIDNPNRIGLLYGRKIEQGATVRIVAELFIQDRHMSLCLCPAQKIHWRQDGKLVQSAPNQMGLSITAVLVAKININIEAYGLNAVTTLDVDRQNSYNRNLFINIQGLYHIPLLIPPKSTLLLGQEVRSVEQLTLHSPNIIVSDSITLSPQPLLATTPMLIQVQDIYQLYASAELINLKVDEKFILPISYLNSEGYEFENVEETKFDVLGYTRHVVQVKIVKNSLEITGIDQGYALIKVSCGYNLIDYILVKVGVTLTLAKAYLGSTIKYEIDGAESPIWYSNCGDFRGNQLTVLRELTECYVEVNDQGNKFRAGLEVIRPQYVSIESNKVGQNLQVKLHLHPKLPIQANVNPNFEVNINIDQSEWFEVQQGDVPLEYIIKPIIASSNVPMPKKFQLTAVITNSQLHLDGNKELTFERDFQLSTREVTIQKSEPIQTIKVPYFRNVDKTHQDSQLQGIISTSYVDGNVEITLDFSQCHEATEGIVYFENQQQLRVRFVLSQQYDSVIFVAALGINLLL